MSSISRPIALLMTLLTALPAFAQNLGTPPLPIKIELQYLSKLLPALNTPATQGLLGTVGALLPKPVDMKLLILATDGTEPGLAALKYLLDHLGTPYRVVLLAAGQQLPALESNGKGLYQGIILTSGNLGICDPACRSALPVEEWVRMDKYTRDYKVRSVSYYTYPEARYGLTPLSAVGTSDVAPGIVNLTTTGGSIFKYIRPSATIKVMHSWVYLAGVAPVAGESTTPIMTLGSSVVGVTSKKADGREYMAFTFDNNPYLFHSALFHYGIVHWVTKGIFLGSRKTYLTPQVDDHFLANDLFDQSNAACIPVGFTADPTFDPANQCPTLRIRGWDLTVLANWQNTIRANPQFSQFRVSHAFNGLGATAEGGATANDSLVAETKRLRSSFIWINHTYSHENLDCYSPAPNSGVCRPATLAESLMQIDRGASVASTLGLPHDSSSMVTPNISGLNNPAFMSAAAQRGIKFLIADLSRPEGVPASPNTGIWNRHQPSVLMIPRRATNIFYNTSTGFNGIVGSEPDEYNYFYGPNGIFRIGGPGGPPFFTTNQTWQNVADRESDNLLGYMLRGEVYPSMFHQGNLHAYDGNKSLFSEVVGGTLSKFAALSNWPVISLPQGDVGRLMIRRMEYNSSQVSATLTPGLSIEIRTVGAARIPITGVCSEGCETYGADKQSLISLPARGVRTILNLGGSDGLLGLLF